MSCLDFFSNFVFVELASFSDFVQSIVGRKKIFICVLYDLFNAQFSLSIKYMQVNGRVLMRRTWLESSMVRIFLWQAKVSSKFYSRSSSIPISKISLTYIYIYKLQTSFPALLYTRVSRKMFRRTLHREMKIDYNYFCLIFSFLLSPSHNYIAYLSTLI